MEVRGDLLTDKENAGAALVDAMKEVKGLEPVAIGSYRGFQMSLTLEDFGKQYILTLKGRMSHRVELGKDPRGNLVRIDNVLSGMDGRLARVQEKLDALYVQLETAKAELGKPLHFRTVGRNVKSECDLCRKLTTRMLFGKSSPERESTIRRDGVPHSLHKKRSWYLLWRISAIRAGDVDMIWLFRIRLQSSRPKHCSIISSMGFPTWKILMILSLLLTM